MISGQGIGNRSGLGVAGGYPDPAGGNTAFRVTKASPSAALSRTATTAVTPGATYTLSRIARRANFDSLRLTIGDASFVNTTYLWFDLSTNTLGNLSTGGTGFGLVSRSIKGLGRRPCHLDGLWPGTCLGFQYGVGECELRYNSRGYRRRTRHRQLLRTLEHLEIGATTSPLSPTAQRQPVHSTLLRFQRRSQSHHR